MLSSGGGYVLDANVFITSANNYYPLDIAPSFWRQLGDIMCDGETIIIDAVFNEVTCKDDGLSDWLKSNVPEDKIVECAYSENVVKQYKSILEWIKDDDKYSDAALSKWSDQRVADPWIIAVAAVKNAKIVTCEGKSGAISSICNNPKIPNIAEAFGVECITVQDYMREMSIVL